MFNASLNKTPIRFALSILISGLISCANFESSSSEDISNDNVNEFKTIFVDSSSTYKYKRDSIILNYPSKNDTIKLLFDLKYGMDENQFWHRISELKKQGLVYSFSKSKSDFVIDVETANSYQGLLNFYPVFENGALVEISSHEYGLPDYSSLRKIITENHDKPILGLREFLPEGFYPTVDSLTGWKVYKEFPSTHNTNYLWIDNGLLIEYRNTTIGIGHDFNLLYTQINEELKSKISNEINRKKRIEDSILKSKEYLRKQRMTRDSLIKKGL